MKAVQGSLRRLGLETSDLYYQHLEENLAAADVRLTEAELSELEDLSAKINSQGGRYPAHLEAQTDL